MPLPSPSDFLWRVSTAPPRPQLPPPFYIHLSGRSSFVPSPHLSSNFLSRGFHSEFSSWDRFICMQFGAFENFSRERKGFLFSGACTFLISVGKSQTHRFLFVERENPEILAFVTPEQTKQPGNRFLLSQLSYLSSSS